MGQQSAAGCSDLVVKLEKKLRRLIIATLAIVAVPIFALVGLVAWSEHDCQQRFYKATVDGVIVSNTLADIAFNGEVDLERSSHQVIPSFAEFAAITGAYDCKDGPGSVAAISTYPFRGTLKEGRDTLHAALPRRAVLADGPQISIGDTALDGKTIVSMQDMVRIDGRLYRAHYTFAAPYNCPLLVSESACTVANAYQLYNLATQPLREVRLDYGIPY